MQSNIIEYSIHQSKDKDSTEVRLCTHKVIKCNITSCDQTMNESDVMVKIHTRYHQYNQNWKYKATVQSTIHIKVPKRFPKWNSRTFQGLIKDKFTFFKHYGIIIWLIVNMFFCDEITCYTPNYNIHHWKCGHYFSRPYKVIFKHFSRKIANFQDRLKNQALFKTVVKFKHFSRSVGTMHM